MNKIVFRDGYYWPTFPSLVNSLFLNTSHRVVALRFTEDSKYIQENSKEQYDWLKIVGKGSLSMKEGPEGYLVRKSEAILVWRYLPEHDVFQVARHYRINGVRQPILPRHIKTMCAGDTRLFSMAFTKGFGPVRIFPYFGGTSPEPKNGKNTIIYVK